MECFISLGVFTIDQLCVLGRYRKFFAVHSLAEILCCDGRTAVRTFSSIVAAKASEPTPKKPLHADMVLWISALKLITSPNVVLSQSLGRYLLDPPQHDGWYV